MTRPAILNEDVVVVPREPTREMWAAMADTLYGYKNRHHDKVAGDLFRAMLFASPHADAWAEVRAYVAGLETTVKTLEQECSCADEEQFEWEQTFNAERARAEVAAIIAALTAERDALLAALTESETERQEQSRLLGMSAERELAMLARKETAERQLAEAVDALEPFAKEATDFNGEYRSDWISAEGNELVGSQFVDLTFGDFCRARDVVRKVKGRNTVEKQNSGEIKT